MTNDETNRLTRSQSTAPADMVHDDIWGTNLPNGMLLWFSFDFDWAAVAKEITSAEWDVVRGRLKVNHAKCDTLLEASKALLRKSGLARWDDQTFAFVPMYPGNEDYEFEEHWKEEFHSRFGRYMAWVLFSVGAENLAKAACVCNKAVDPLGTHLQVQVLHVLDHHLPGSRRRGRVPTETICYCRVSSPKQRDDLQRQVVFMRERYPDARVVTDVGGGLNFQRKGLVALLERLHRGDKLRIVVAHRDRLARFGFALIRWMAEQNGGEIVVLGNTDYSPQQELTEDILAILHTFSCRLHGLRRYRNAIQADTGLSDSSAATDAETLV